MSFNQNTGVYTPAAGALTAAPGQVVQSAIWDGIFADMTSAFTTAMQALQATYGQRNIIGANGGLEVWQRGAGASSSISVGAGLTTGQYTADRWYLATNANQVSTVAAVAGIVNGSRLAAKVQRNNAQTGVGAQTFGFPLDTDECAMIQGQICALSFTAKAGANWSPAGGTLSVSLLAGTGSPIRFAGSGYTNLTTPINTVSANLTTSPQRFTFVSAVVATTTTQAEVTLTWTPVGTAGADDSFTIDNVQLEILPSATSPIAGFENWPFERMLAACKRHYRKSFPYSVAPVQGAAIQGAATLVTAAAAASGFWIQHTPISLRATATYTSYQPNNASANALNVQANVSLAVSLDGAGTNSPDTTLIYVSAAASAGAMIAIHWQADAGI
jgi:hypothetical protein